MKIPEFIYGTAWKEERTEELVTNALNTGFRAIDTANQRKHYYEEGIGKALSKCGIENIFIQTKFTSLSGQDHRLPYDPNSDGSLQVRASFESSLVHLKVDHIDSYVLHGPTVSVGLSEEDWKFWREMEAIQKDGLVTYLGISNVNLEQLKLLWGKSKIKPTFVQNRCFAQTKWDKEIRDFCSEKEIRYQGFSLLTANPFVLPAISKLAQSLNKTPEQIVFRFAQQVGMIPLTGTTSIAHMKEDLSLGFELEKEQVEAILNIES